jgi:hypothetical protein
MAPQIAHSVENSRARYLSSSDFGLVLDASTFKFSNCRIIGRLRRVHSGEPLFDIFLAYRLFLRQLVEDFLLILLVSEFDFGSFYILGCHLDVQLQDVDVLFGLGELRFDLLDFVLGKSKNEDSHSETGSNQNKENYKGCVIPEADVKSQ